MQPREYTTDEVRKIFTDHVNTMISAWAGADAAQNTTGLGDVPWRLEGLAHSIFAALDGCSLACPGFIVAPFPDESDAEDHRKHGENWFPYNDASGVSADIAGSLRHWRSDRKDQP